MHCSKASVGLTQRGGSALRLLLCELFAQSESTQCSRANFVHDVMERVAKIEKNVAPFTQAIEYLQKVMDEEAVNRSGQDPPII